MASAVGGVVVSKPMAKNTTSRSGSFSAMRNRVERRIDHADVGARRLGLQQARAARGRHAHQVAVGAQRHLRPRAQSIAVSMRPIGKTQTGQPGPWIIRTFVGQQILDAVA